MCLFFLCFKDALNDLFEHLEAVKQAEKNIELISTCKVNIKTDKEKETHTQIVQQP